MISEEELRRMYWDEGMTQNEIGKSVGVSSSVILRLMGLYEIESRTLSEAKLGNSIKPSERELRQMYCVDKMSQSEIGNVVGVSKTTVSRWMKEYKIGTRTLSEAQSGRPYQAQSLNPLKPSKEDMEEMYWNREMSQKEIAREIGVSATTIFDWICSYNIALRTLSEIRSGENNGNWHGGISSEPYCYKFNNIFKEAVRGRYNYTCQLCGSDQNGRKLDVHHIHYDKSNCYPDVVALCRSCHGEVNGNRNYWEQYFENQLFERGLLNWTVAEMI